MDPDDQRKTILVVDDDASIRQLTRRLLEAAGYRVLNAADGGEGLDIFQQHRAHISLVLTDVSMPGMDGFQLAERVRELHSQVQILLMSGVAQHAACGFGCVAKPFQPAELIGRVGEILSAAA